MVIPALAKANPDDHWAMYDRVYGGPFVAVVMRPLKSAAQIDESFAADPKSHISGSSFCGSSVKRLFLSCAHVPMCVAVI